MGLIPRTMTALGELASESILIGMTTADFARESHPLFSSVSPKPPRSSTRTDCRFKQASSNGQVHSGVGRGCGEDCLPGGVEEESEETLWVSIRRSRMSIAVAVEPDVVDAEDEECRERGGVKSTKAS